MSEFSECLSYFIKEGENGYSSFGGTHRRAVQRHC